MRVDYERIAAGYDSRYKFSLLPGVERGLDEIRHGRVLEAGCGTGRWLRTGDTGLDRSPGMLERVRAGERVNADACAMPFRDASFDTVFCVNAVHHFDDRQAFIREARRVLRPGGTLAIVGMDIRRHRHRWYTYDWFEGTWENDLRRFPRWGELADAMLDAGFGELRLREVERVINVHRGADILSDPFLSQTASSQLALLSEEVYSAGLARIRAAVQENSDLEFRADLSLEMLSGLT